MLGGDWVRRTVAAAAFALAAVALVSCSSGQSSGALEHEACVEVHHSLTLYATAAHDAPAAARAARTAAENLLRAALQPAAIASAGDADYQALSATLSETSRVPESQLTTALSDQCAAVLNPSG